MSASVIPVAYSIACDPPWDLGCVTVLLNLLSDCSDVSALAGLVPVASRTLRLLVC